MAIQKRELQPKQLLNLPHEILESIFDEIPLWYLNRIKDIEPIKPYVLSTLYSSVVIRDSGKYKVLVMQDYSNESKFLDMWNGNSLCEFETFESFALFVNENRLTKPTHICTYGINVFVESYKSHPEIFGNGKVTIWSRKDELANHDYQKLKNIPCNFDEFTIKEDYTWGYPETTLRFFEGESDWMNGFNLISIGLDYVDRNFIHQPFYSNLTGVDFYKLEAEDMQYLPKNLKQLKCNVPGSRGPFLDLPNTLELLSISFGRNRELNLNLNFAYLTNLKHLLIHTGYCKKAVYGFPSSLVTLYIYGNSNLPTKKDISVCPNLKAFNE